MIAVGGEALIDLVIRPDGTVEAKLGGGPFNSARTIGRLGGAVSFLGTLSGDRFGGMLRHQLVADAVAIAGASSELPTTLAAAELDESGAASYRFYFTATSAPELVDSALPAGTSAIHVGTLGFVFEPMATTLESMVSHVGDDVLVFVDPNCRPLVIDDRAAYIARLDRVLARADVVKISTDDAAYLAPDLTPVELAHRMVAAGARLVLVTGGSQPAHAVGAHMHLEVPTPRVVVADTIGAGDAFGGSFLHWWMSNGLGRAELADQNLVSTAIFRANVVAGKTCERVGADPPFLADLDPEWSGRG